MHGVAFAVEKGEGWADSEHEQGHGMLEKEEKKRRRNTSIPC